MKRLESIIEDLRAAEQTSSVQNAIAGAVNLRSSLARAQNEIKLQESREEEGTLPTSSEQEKVNEPLAKEIEVTDEEIVEAKEETKKSGGFLGLGNKS